MCRFERIATTVSIASSSIRLLGRIVVDFAVGDVAALAAHANEREELGAAVLRRILLIGAVAVEKRLLVARAARLAPAPAALCVRVRPSRIVGLILFLKVIGQIGNVFLVIVDVVIEHGVQIAGAVIVVFGQIVVILTALGLRLF